MITIFHARAQVGSLILVLLSQILRPHGEKLGADLSPATDRPQLVGALDSGQTAHPVNFRMADNPGRNSHIQ